jgi:predicted DNA-binding transcriptional regulator AlpA
VLRGRPTQNRIEADRLLCAPVVAEILGLKEDTLTAWRRRGQGPPYVRLSRRAVRYSARDLEAWVLHRHRAPGSPEAAAP